MQTITPFLWFDNQAEEAARFYMSVFERSRMLEVMHYGEAGPGEAGSVMSVTFELDGQKFIALNGGPNPAFTFSPAISMFIECETQDEVDTLWERLSAGGETQRCGWLRDKFGICWQVVPRMLGRLLVDPDKARSMRVMRAMMQMRKLDIAGLQRAYNEA